LAVEWRADYSGRSLNCNVVLAGCQRVICCTFGDRSATGALGSRAHRRRACGTAEPRL